MRTATMVESLRRSRTTAKAFIRSSLLLLAPATLASLSGGVEVGDKRKEPQLRVIDRCKSIFKLAGGEYVNPAGQRHYSAVDCVRQVFVTGSSSTYDRYGSGR